MINVLVVDSDSDTCHMVSDILNARYPNIDVNKIHDGEDAIEYLTEHGDYLDAIVLGTDMPHTDGWELLRIAKDEDNWPTVPVVMMITEQRIWEDSLKAHTIGAEHFVSKPIKSFELFNVLDILLGEEVA